MKNSRLIIFFFTIFNYHLIIRVYKIKPFITVLFVKKFENLLKNGFCSEETLRQKGFFPVDEFLNY